MNSLIMHFLSRLASYYSNMFATYLIALGLSIWVVGSDRVMKTNTEEIARNLSHPDKDMYVIHATVYEVGILTNKTDNTTKNSSAGNQESVTFFNTKGSNVDLGAITAPVLTNVTAQSLLGVAPVNNDTKTQIESWDNWSQLAPLQNPTAVVSSGNMTDLLVQNPIRKRDLNFFMRTLFRRDLRLNGNDTVKVTNGYATIPAEVGVESIALPPLLSLNNNLSNIPVPIPNTSLVKYAKINTLVHAP